MMRTRIGSVTLSVNAGSPRSERVEIIAREPRSGLCVTRRCPREDAARGMTEVMGVALTLTEAPG